MSEMVERVACALDPDAFRIDGGLPGEADRDRARSLAREAIAATRELSDQDAFILLRTFNLKPDDLHMEAARDWHRRMIDRALK